MNMEKTITFQLSPISVVVNITGELSDKEIAELGKKEVIKQLSKKFPFYEYSVVNGQVIEDTDVKPGRPVKLKDSGEIGIIYEVKPKQKFPIKIVLGNGQAVGCTKVALEKASKKTKIEKLIKGREQREKEMGGWHTGKTAFFVNRDKVIPVVLTAGKSNVKAYVVDHEAQGEFYTLSAEQANRLLFDTYIEAEKRIK